MTTKKSKTAALPLGTKRPMGGYVQMKVAEGKGAYGWELEHRVVMKKMLGRDLLPGESVHHIDGDRTNNDPSNLELWVGTIRYGQRAADIKCRHCGEPYL